MRADDPVIAPSALGNDNDILCIPFAVSERPTLRQGRERLCRNRPHSGRFVDGPKNANA